MLSPVIYYIPLEARHGTQTSRGFCLEPIEAVQEPDQDISYSSFNWMAQYANDGGLMQVLSL